jgi:tetratricopeptide (TPR) repeat protein
MPKWNPFPFDSQAYRYDSSQLEKQWSELHGGDCEPFPGDPALLKAWAAYHAGDFRKAVDLADDFGLAAHAVANKATGIYANYLEEDEQRQVALFQQTIARAEDAIREFPDDPNAHYFHAFNLGRYSQSISVVKAVKQGYAGKIRDSLESALQLQPRHAEAHTAMGLYHAEIIDKMGKLIGSMTYGASESESIEHLQRAVSLTPKAPIARIEYANGLYLLYGDKRIDEVTDLYIEASELRPRDAMERLDVEYARSELE